MIISSVLIVILVGAIATTQSNKVQNGHLVDSLRRFPHHVTIETDNANWNDDKSDQTWNRICGGSILNEQWILTSAFCIDGSDRLQLHFEQLYYNSHNDDGSFTIVVNKKEIHIHPTLYYDIALIRLPIVLIFSDILKPVSISSSPVNLWEGRLAVMPGFDVQRKPAITSTTTTTTTTSGPEGTVSGTNTSSETRTPTTEWISTEYTTISTTEDTTTESVSTTTEDSTTASTSTTGEDSTTESASTIEELTTESTSTTAEWSSTEDTTTIPSRYKRDVSLLKHLNAFNQPQEQRLIYGMFRVLSNNRCKSSHNNFDEFLQMCTENWIIPTFSDDESTPCWNYGSGLIVGWPADSKLIGIYSSLLNSCNSSQPAIYTNVAEYLPWIESIIYTLNP